MKIALIEDEAPALNRLKKMIQSVLPQADFVATADSIESAVKLFRTHTTLDLVFMDIELADGQSFELFHQVEITCPVVFTTAYDEFAIKAFKVNAVDYLLKPIDKDELRTAIEKCSKHQKESVDYSLQLKELLASMKADVQVSYKNRFLIRNGSKLLSIPVEDILLFHAADKLVYAHTKQQQKLVIDYTLDELIDQLDPKYFFQLNRQFIAHVSSIKSIHTYFNGKLKVELTRFEEEEVLVSRERASEFKQWLNQ